MSENRRILIVDDNTQIHQDFRKILTVSDAPSHALAALEIAALGKSNASLSTAAWLSYEIFSAYQADEALAMVKQAEATGKPFAVVFMDVRMPPSMDGVAATAKLWQISPFTEVVLCSAYVDYTWEEVVHTLAPSDRLLFLRKPFDTMEVRQLAMSLSTKWNLGLAARAKITDLQQEALRLAHQAEEERAKRIEAAKMASLGEMAAGIAHEINNPLAIIQGTISQLDNWLENSEATQKIAAETFVKRVSRTADRIAKIVHGLLMFARSGQNDPFEKTETISIINSTVSFTGARFNAAGIQLQINVPDQGLAIFCRPVQVSQVLFNLLSNAYDAVLGQEAGWIRVDATPQKDHIEIAVTDSGAGIPTEMREKILFPFFTTKDVGKGTGLGLSIAKGIMESHGGSLYLDDKSPHTRFILKFPHPL